MTPQELESVWKKIDEHTSKLADHESTLAVIRADLNRMAPLVESMHPLQADVAAVMASQARTEVQIGKLAETVDVALQRIAAGHEESIKRAAAQVEERHAAELAAKELVLSQARQALEDKKFVNMARNVYGPLLALIIGGGGAAGILWQIFAYLSNHVPR